MFGHGGRGGFVRVQLGGGRRALVLGRPTENDGGHETTGEQQHDEDQPSTPFPSAAMSSTHPGKFRRCAPRCSSSVMFVLFGIFMSP